jgi:hypothetical protein
MMGRNNRHDMMRMSKNRRASAMERVELRQGTEPRRSPAGVTSAPLKAEDPELRRMIDEALARRQ